MKIRIIVLFLLINTQAFSQAQENKLLHDPGVYLGGNWSKDVKLNFVPQVWFYAGDFYIEGRYNYEDEKTFSVHLGYPVEIDELKMELTPTAGLVFGNFKGYVLGMNGEYSSRYINGFAENEYCFSSVNTNFFFSWVGITTPLTKRLSLGGSLQYTLEPFNSVFDAGPMISWKKGLIQFEFYSYNPWKESRYWQFGISLDLGAKE
jgi:hypothetical protein